MIERKCKYCTNPAKKNIRPDGRNKGYYRTCGSLECLKMQYKNNESNKKKGRKGPEHHFYKQDRSQIKSPRPRYENTWWRRNIFERDNYTCQICGIKGGKLQADHIKSYALYPDLRWELDNGRTLCEKCHKKTPNYAGKARLKNNKILQNAF